METVFRIIGTIAFLTLPTLIFCDAIVYILPFLGVYAIAALIYYKVKSSKEKAEREEKDWLEYYSYHPEPTSEEHLTQDTEDAIPEISEKTNLTEGGKDEEFLKIVEDNNTDCTPFIFDVAGLCYRTERARENLSYCSAFSEVKLRREPSNQYDEFAVKVLIDGTFAGYVPRKYSKAISTAIVNRKISDKVMSDLTVVDGEAEIIEITVYIKK